jgi:hypothetical protein
MELVKLAEGTVVDLEVVEEAVDVRSLAPPGTDEGLIQVYEVLWVVGLTVDITTLPSGITSISHRSEIEEHRCPRQCMAKFMAR